MDSFKRGMKESKSKAVVNERSMCAIELGLGKIDEICVFKKI